MTMGTVKYVLVAAAVALSSAALACGPTRNKHVTTIEIDAPAAKVWDVVGNYADFGWTGKVAKTEVTGDLVPDVAHRKLTFSSGAVFTDQLSTLDAAKMTIAFLTESEDVHELPVDNYASRITVRDENGHAVVEWRAAFVRGYPKNDPPPELNDEAAIAAVTAFQDTALANLKHTLEASH
jgi:hypothetical protein